MIIKKIEYDTGIVDYIEYSREDAKGRRVNGFIKDIYTKIPDFNENIYRISGIHLKNDYTIEDVLDSFTIDKGEDKFIICQAGTLMKIPDNDIEGIINHIERERGYILNAYFYNMIFNRTMSHCYGNRDICIYSNDKTEKFINENIGKATSGKIINRLISSGKI